MKADAFLDGLRHMPITTPASFVRDRVTVVLSPHPDDDALGVGGLIASACAAGQVVHVVVLTDGAGSHTGSTQYPPARLVALRKAEMATAAARLGLPASHIAFLDLPDARAPSGGPDFDATVARIGAIVDAVGARLLLVTWGRDPHCDHEAAEAMARAVRDRRPDLDLWCYPIWGWHLAADTILPDPAPDGLRLDIGPWRDAKRGAIAAHASQMTDLIADDPDGFRFTPATLAPFLAAHETVFRVPR